MAKAKKETANWKPAIVGYNVLTQTYFPQEIEEAISLGYASYKFPMNVTIVDGLGDTTLVVGKNLQPCSIECFTVINC